MTAPPPRAYTPAFPVSAEQCARAGIAILEQYYRHIEADGEYPNHVLDECERQSRELYGVPLRQLPGEGRLPRETPR